MTDFKRRIGQKEAVQMAELLFYRYLVWNIFQKALKGRQALAWGIAL